MVLWLREAQCDVWRMAAAALPLEAAFTVGYDGGVNSVLLMLGRSGSGSRSRSGGRSGGRSGSGGRSLARRSRFASLNLLYLRV